VLVWSEADSLAELLGVDIKKPDLLELRPVFKDDTEAQESQS
jgi:hypothetical protein